MRKKSFIIGTSTILAGIVVALFFYTGYLKKITIYDLVNIEFSGVPKYETNHIDIYGITPLNKKILLKNSYGTTKNQIPGCYQFIELIIPDNIVPKITSIHIVLKEQTHTISAYELKSQAFSEKTNSFVLPKSVKSKSNFFKKLSSAYPFNVILSSPLLLALIFIILFITFTRVLDFLRKHLHKNETKYSRIINNNYVLINKKSVSNIYLPVFLFIITFIWRLSYLNTPYIFCDEAFTIFHAQGTLLDILKLPASGEANPPLFMLLLHLWIKVFGIGIYSVRILPILFNSLTVLFIYFSGKKLSGVSTGILASGIFIFSTYNFNFGMDVRAYSLFSMLTAASLYFFLLLINNSFSKRNLVLLIFSNSLLIYTHYLGWFIIGIQFITGLIYIKNRKIFKSIIISIIITCVAYAPMFSIITKQYFISVKDNFRQHLLYPDLYGYFNQISSLLNTKSVFFIITLILLAGIINVIFINKSKNRIPRDLIVIMLWWLIPYTIMFLLSKKIPIFLDKYLLFNSIGLYLFLGYAINFMFKKRQVLVLCILLHILMFSQIDIKSRHYSHSKVKESVDGLRVYNGNNDIVIFNSFFKYQLMYYYDRNIFKDYGNFDSLLSQNRIYPCDNLIDAKKSLNKISLSKYVIVHIFGKNIKSFEHNGNSYLNVDNFFYPDCLNIRVFTLAENARNIK